LNVFIYLEMGKLTVLLTADWRNWGKHCLMFFIFIF